MKYKIITSHQDSKIEIEDGDDVIIIKETENGNLSIVHMSMDKDLKIIPRASNTLELEFTDKIRRNNEKQSREA